MEEAIRYEYLPEFEDVYNSYYIPVYRYFMKRLGNKESCEDLTGDVFYSCLKSYGSYDPSKSKISTWIYTIASNKLKNYYRDKKEHVSIDGTEAISALPDGTDMDKAVYITQMKEHLTAAFCVLSERERTVVKLKYFSGLTSEEAALQAGTTSGNIRVILTRALKKLAVYFDDNGIEWVV